MEDKQTMILVQYKTDPRRLDPKQHCFRENNCVLHTDHEGETCCCCGYTHEEHEGCDCEDY